jgi:hypothetical protein
MTSIPAEVIAVCKEDDKHRIVVRIVLRQASIPEPDYRESSEVASIQG